MSAPIRLSRAKAAEGRGKGRAMKRGMRFAVFVVMVGCLSALAACGDINIGSGQQDIPVNADRNGRPGDRCSGDGDCLSNDCNDGAGVCR